MRRRRELKSVAYDMASSFVSRNNDVDGYWAIGQLLNLATANSQLCVRLDLVSRELAPPWPKFEKMAGVLWSMLCRQLECRLLPLTYLRHAILTLTFEMDPDNVHGIRPFECRIEITDDLNRMRAASRTGCCRPHDPRRELRSARE